ncbi:thioredoxin-like domain-containing protein [Diplogelasinospora grovesii]|uniref:protein disulfide-isomerase n=1 Tax=Diplogelasinospora grovesii TaxID=303347 RepID=A0AAN6MZ74_9PEZI|nr:thioredoxin-like domain-containing protein [Diplogelasinospora grovesii]
MQLHRAALCLIALFQFGHAWDHVSPNQLEQTLADNEYLLVALLIIASPKSASLEPEWLAATADNDQHRLVSIDCTANPDTCHSLPSVQLFQDQPFQDGKSVAVYQGPRRAEALTHFISRHKRPLFTALKSSQDLSASKVVDETVFILFGDRLDDHDTDNGPTNSSDKDAQRIRVAAAFSILAPRYRDEFNLGFVSDAALAEQAGIKDFPAVVCYKPIDGDTVLYEFPSGSGDDDEDEDENLVKGLDDWIKEASRPVIFELSTVNHQRLLDRGWPIIYISSPSEPERQKLRKTLYKFARSYYDSLATVLVDPLDFPDLPPRLGLTDPETGKATYPCGAVHQLSKDRVYPYPADLPINSQFLQQWGLDVNQGRIKPWTPPGITTTSYDDLGGPTKVATGRVSMRSNIPGLKVRVGGLDHNEL